MSLMLNSSQGLRSGVWKGEIFRLCEGREWRSWREETIALVPSLSVMELDSDSYSIAWDSITAGYAYLWYTVRAELPTSESSPAESKIEIKVPTSDSRAKPFCPIAWSSVKQRSSSLLLFRKQLLFPKKSLFLHNSFVEEPIRYAPLFARSLEIKSLRPP